MRPALLYSDAHSVVSVSVIPKCVTLNDLDWLYFALNSVFALVWLAPTVRLSKINYVKTNEDRQIVSTAQIFGKNSSFWQYKVYAGIRRRSLERSHQTTVWSPVHAHVQRSHAEIYLLCV